MVSSNQPSSASTGPSLGVNPGFAPFLRLPLECRLMIWKHAAPSPQIIQIHCIYPARAANISRDHKCDIDAMTRGDQVEFGTDTVASGLLRDAKSPDRKSSRSLMAVSAVDIGIFFSTRRTTLSSSTRRVLAAIEVCLVCTYGPIHSQTMQVSSKTSKSWLYVITR